MSFDVSTVEVADTLDVTINNPKTGEPFMVPVEGQTALQPMSVTLYGPGSKEYKAAQNQSRKTYALTFHRGKSRETPEQEEARTARLLADITVSFNNFTYKDGDPKAHETHRALYIDPKMGWITSQLDGEVGDWGNSVKAAPSS
jgi:hypothetical protein